MLSGGLVLGVERLALIAVQFALLLEFAGVLAERLEVGSQLVKVSRMRVGVEWIRLQFLEFLHQPRVLPRQLFVVRVHTCLNSLRFLGHPDHVNDTGQARESRSTRVVRRQRRSRGICCLPPSALSTANASFVMHPDAVGRPSSVL